MFCKKCGNILPDTALFCNSCGAKVERSASAPQQPVYRQPVYQQPPQPGYQRPAQPYQAPANVPKVGFLDAVTAFFTRYADFKGRSRRSEYWWVVLFNMLVSALITALVPDLVWLSSVYALVTLIPGIAICIRRLHDTGKSGWYWLIALIPLVGGILLLVQMCQDSGPANQWGPNPKQR